MLALLDNADHRRVRGRVCTRLCACAHLCACLHVGDVGVWASVWVRVCVRGCLCMWARLCAYARVCVCAVLVCGRPRGCVRGCMGASVCVRMWVLGHIAATVPELACSHDKRCTPNLSGCARRSGPRLRPNIWLFLVTVVLMGSLLRIVLCMPSGVRSSA
jgi:hypothetical protein